MFAELERQVEQADVEWRWLQVETVQPEPSSSEVPLHAKLRAKATARKAHTPEPPPPAIAFPARRRHACTAIGNEVWVFGGEVRHPSPKCIVTLLSLLPPSLQPLPL